MRSRFHRNRSFINQIASGLQNAAEGYLTLASHVSKIAPYELPQIITQIPPPPIDVPMPIRRPGGSQYWQKKKQTAKPKSTTSHTDSGTE